MLIFFAMIGLGVFAYTLIAAMRKYNEKVRTVEKRLDRHTLFQEKAGIFDSNDRWRWDWPYIKTQIKGIAIMHYAASLISFVLLFIIGASLFALFENLGFVDSIYFASVTITTIGM